MRKALRRRLPEGSYGSGKLHIDSTLSPEVHMTNLAKALVGVAALAFIVAVVTVFTGKFLVGPEGWSRAATNLALLALCLFVGFKEGDSA